MKKGDRGEEKERACLQPLQGAHAGQRDVDLRRPRPDPRRVKKKRTKKESGTARCETSSASRKTIGLLSRARAWPSAKIPPRDTLAQSSVIPWHLWMLPGGDREERGWGWMGKSLKKARFGRSDNGVPKTTKSSLDPRAHLIAYATFSGIWERQQTPVNEEREQVQRSVTE